MAKPSITAPATKYLHIVNPASFSIGAKFAKAIVWPITTVISVTSAPASPNNARIIAAYIPLKSGALTYDAIFTSYCLFGFCWTII